MAGGNEKEKRGETEHGGVRMRALRCALPYSLPIGAGFFFLALSYGFLMASKGFAVWYPLAMSALIYTGTMEFVTVNLLLSAFAPVSAFVLAVVVGARHLFYGLSMLERYRGMGWKKPYLIFALCDETFAVNSSAEIPANVDRGWFMLWVTLLNQLWWVGGAVCGAVAGQFVNINTEGIEFVLTALFVCVFVDQWIKEKNHVPAIVGVVVSIVCLIVLGPDAFIIPAMVAIVAIFGLQYLRQKPGAGRSVPAECAGADACSQSGSFADASEPEGDEKCGGDVR